MGLGYQEADMMGGSLIYSRYAGDVAQNANVGFDQHAFFVAEATEAQLAGVVVTIANCSQEAVNLTSYRLADRDHVERSDELYDRLVSLFTVKAVERKAHLIGSSTTDWEVDAIVKLPGIERPVVFEAVTNHKNSVASTTMKFQDIARLERPPARVSVVKDKRSLGTLLGVLSQTSSVIESSTSDDTYRQLAKAA
jgi:hypothetical protein